MTGGKSLRRSWSASEIERQLGPVSEDEKKEQEKKLRTRGLNNLKDLE